MEGSPTTSPPETRVCRECGAPFEREPVVVLGVTVPTPYCDPCSARLASMDAEQERARRVETLIQRAGMPAGWQDWTLDTFPTDHGGVAALKRAIDWLDGAFRGDGRNLILFGDVGVGKSGLAWSLIRRACEQGRDALMVNWRDYLHDLRETFRSNERPDWRPLHVPILALDDLGAERPTGFAVEELATLVDTRHRERLPVIVTSNYTPAELIVRLGDGDDARGKRIVSRLVDRAVQVRMTGPDRRLRRESA